MSRHRLVGPIRDLHLKRKFQFEFLKEQGLKPHHYLLDVGCGTLRGGIPLIEYLDEGHYYGTEVREHVLEEGRSELQEAGLADKHPVLVATEDFDVGDETKFDFLWAFSVLIHLTDELLDVCFAKVSHQLKEDGVFYANVNLAERAPGKWEEFPVMAHTLDFYKEVGARHGLVVEDIGIIAEYGHVTGSQHQDNQHMLKITLDH